jgi:hypothetical protein
MPYDINNRIGGSAVTMADGTYVIRGLRPDTQNYRVSFVPDPDTSYKAKDFATRVAVTLGATTNGVNATLGH